MVSTDGYDERHSTRRRWLHRASAAAIATAVLGVGATGVSVAVVSAKHSGGSSGTTATSNSSDDNGSSSSSGSSSSGSNDNGSSSGLGSASSGSTSHGGSNGSCPRPGLGARGAAPSGCLWTPLPSSAPPAASSRR